MAHRRPTIEGARGRPGPAAPSSAPEPALDPTALADRLYAAFNRRDLDTYLALLTEDVRIEVDTLTITGHEAARAYLDGILHTYPGVLVGERRTVAVTLDTVVSEFRLVNPQAGTEGHGHDPWRLDGLICEIVALRDGRVAGVRSYYAPTDRDRTGVTEVPSRGEAARIADEQATLRRVASQVSHDVADAEVFAAVNEGIARLAGAHVSVLIRFEPDDTLSLLAVEGPVARPEPGSAWQPAGEVVRGIRDAGMPQRWDGTTLTEVLPFLDGTTAGEGRALAIPVRVGGQLWGLGVLVATEPHLFPDGTEEQITEFVEFVGPALAQAQANDELHRVVLEQTELRRVAEVAAAAADTQEVFAALTRSASAVLGGRPTSLVRFDDQGHGVLVATHAGGAVAGEVESSAAVAVPIMVEGRRWGTLAASSSDHPLPADTEQRLSKFVGIVVAAIASAQARAELRALADEQAALRRVAELVARGEPQQDLFDAVASEAAELVDECTTLMRVEDGTTCSVVGAGRSSTPVGTRITVPVDDGGVVAEIRRTGRPARVDDSTTRTGPAYARDKLGVRSSVGVPIILEDRLWGILSTTTADHRLPLGTEQRLQQFAGLVSAALANADARAQVHALVDEQSALRRVAEVAAREAPAEEVLQAVADQAARLTGVRFASLLCFEDDGSSIIVSVAGAPAGIEAGMRASGAGGGAIPRVWRTGRPARVDDLSRVTGGWAEVMSGLGFSASVAVPILIRGHRWGALVVVGAHGSLPAGIEDHLASFAELAGTGISAAQTRVELRAVAEEQTALRRVAELVARGAPLDQVLAATAAEASTLMGGMSATLMRYTTDDDAVVIAAANSPAPLGLRVPLSEDTGTGIVRRTGLAHRTDDFARTSLAAVAAELGVRTAVSVPVILEGSVWGALSTTSAGPPIPQGTEGRLEQFAELAAAAIATAQNKAELLASRARVLTTADESRRRIQRDVHDGAQQRLVHTIINLKLARDAMAGDGGTAGPLVLEALRNAERANQELRDLVHGILPAALTLGGLRQGIESLAVDLTVPVAIRVEAPRLPANTETTAYYVIAEALTNVTKHAKAGHAQVRVALDAGGLVIDVVDDGVGGADAASGTGLTGLQDRVQASDGVLTITSPPGRGTHVHARIPVREARNE